MTWLSIIIAGIVTYFMRMTMVALVDRDLLGSGGTLWVCWQISTLAGIILGSFVPDELGLKFAVPLTFIDIFL